MKKSIKIAIIDDDDLFRSVLAALIKPYKDIEVILSGANGKDLMEFLKKGQPDLVVLDLDMPVMDGIKTTNYLCKEYPDIKILILTGHTNNEFYNYLIGKGANGFLPKTNNFSLIVDAIYSIAKNGYYLTKPSLEDSIVAKKTNVAFDILKPSVFSKREIQIMELICNQYTNKEISGKLFLSIRTVDGHRNKLLQKANVRNTVGLVLYAIRNNLIKDEKIEFDNRSSIL